MMKSDASKTRLKPTLDELQIMRRRGWLSQTPPEFQREVIKRCRRKAFQSGEPVYRLDEEYGGIYGLVDGGFAISAAATDRGLYLLHFGRPGLWVGAGPLFNHRRRASIIATRSSI